MRVYQNSRNQKITPVTDTCSGGNFVKKWVLTLPSLFTLKGSHQEPLKVNKSQKVDRILFGTYLLSSKTNSFNHKFLNNRYMQGMSNYQYIVSTAWQIKGHICHCRLLDLNNFSTNVIQTKRSLVIYSIHTDLPHGFIDSDYHAFMPFYLVVFPQLLQEKINI